MKTFSETTRRRMSEAAKDRCTPEWRAQKSAAARIVFDRAAAVAMYQSGASIQEVADALGVGRKAVTNQLRLVGVATRPKIKRDQWGEKNHMWKGDSASICKLHRRLDRRFGTPCRCEVCGTTDPSKTYDWANLTGNYVDIHDFKRMCRSCHARYDNKIQNIWRACA